MTVEWRVLRRNQKGEAARATRSHKPRTRKQQSQQSRRQKAEGRRQKAEGRRESRYRYLGHRQIYLASSSAVICCRIMNEKEITPILNVSDIGASNAWFEKWGWKKCWDWGTPPTFWAVGSGECETFLCQGGQGGRGSGANASTFGPQ